MVNYSDQTHSTNFLWLMCRYLKIVENTVGNCRYGKRNGKAGETLVQDVVEVNHGMQVREHRPKRRMLPNTDLRRGCYPITGWDEQSLLKSYRRAHRTVFFPSAVMIVHQCYTSYRKILPISFSIEE